MQAAHPGCQAAQGRPDDAQAVSDAVAKLDAVSGKMQSLERNILQYAEKLGLTPSGRVRLAQKRAQAAADARADSDVISLATRWQSGLHHPVSVYAKQVTQAACGISAANMRFWPVSGTSST